MGWPGARHLTEGDPFTLFCWLLLMLLGLSTNGEVCYPFNIASYNYVSQFQRLEHCTVVEGSLQIAEMDEAAHQELLRSLSFPKLTVITDSLVLFRVSGLVSLSTLFPNLSVIHGRNLFYGNGLAIIEMPDLKDVGLYNLKNITQGAVLIDRNPKLCYVDTVDWSLIQDPDFHNTIRGNKQECGNVCPGVAENRPQCGRTVFNHNYNYRCWSSSHCQTATVWPKLELTMDDTVKVYKDDTVQIPCRYNFHDAKPSKVIIQWLVKAAKSSQRTRIFYGDNDQQMVDRKTEYSERIQVTSDQQGSVLTLRGVRLSDERLFICRVDGLAAGNAEGWTHLRVFGE